MEMNSEGTAIWPIEGAIPVVFSIDAEFALPLGVMLGSIVRSNPQTRFDFLVAVERDDSETMALCHEHLAPGPGNSLRYIDLREVQGAAELATKGRCRIWGAACYNRVLLPRLLVHYDKYLFLDADMLCRGDLRELYEMELGDCYLAAAVDPVVVANAGKNETYHEWMRVRGFNDWANYFNGGVQVVNAARMRSGDVIDRIIALTLENNVSIPDQDAYNIVCSGRVLILPREWNDQVWAYDKIPGYDEPFAAKIVHFTGPKPWKDPERVNAYLVDWLMSVPAEKRAVLWRKVVESKLEAYRELRRLRKKCERRDRELREARQQVRQLERALKAASQPFVRLRRAAKAMLPDVAVQTIRRLLGRRSLKPVAEEKGKEKPANGQA